MAKKINSKKNNLTIGGFLKGNFINRDEFRANYKFFGLIFIMMMTIIYCNHLTSNKIEDINQLKEKTEEFKSRNAYAQSLLINVKMESELGKEMLKDSLKPLENHPHKLLIKLDESSTEKK